MYQKWPPELAHSQIGDNAMIYKVFFDLIRQVIVLIVKSTSVATKTNKHQN